MTENENLQNRMNLNQVTERSGVTLCEIMEEKKYEFKVTLSGCGTTPEEAWENAIEFFSADPGVWDEYDVIENKKCVECGKEFSPEYQGDKDDVRCQECIDKESAVVK